MFIGEKFKFRNSKVIFYLLNIKGEYYYFSNQLNDYDEKIFMICDISELDDILKLNYLYSDFCIILNKENMKIFNKILYSLDLREKKLKRIIKTI